MTVPATRPSEPPRDTDEAHVEASRMTLMEHLDELRSRVLKAAIAFTVAFFGLWVVRAEVTLFIAQPFSKAIGWLNEDLVEIYDARVEEEGADANLFFEPGYPARKVALQDQLFRTDLTNLGFGADMLMKMRVCFWLALLLAGPVALYQAWAFVAAGLYRSERRLVATYFPASLALFLGGVSFGFFVLIPYAAYFLERDGLTGYRNLTVTSDTYLGFIKSLSLAVGITFQLPLIQFVLARLGLVDPAFYRKYRGHTAVITLIVAAVITPPDPVSQMLVATPALVLYEIGAILARLVWVPVPGAVEPAGAQSGARA